MESTPPGSACQPAHPPECRKEQHCQQLASPRLPSWQLRGLDVIAALSGSVASSSLADYAADERRVVVCMHQLCNIYNYVYIILFTPARLRASVGASPFVFGGRINHV